MQINRDKTNPHHYMNKLNVVLSSTGGHGDSLGRTAIAAELYEQDRKELIKGIKDFFLEINGTIHVTRYPEIVGGYMKGNSRDHILKAIAILHRYGDHYFVQEFISKRRSRPGDQMPYTIDQKLYFKALYSKWYSIMYLLIMTPFLTFQITWNKLLFFIGSYTTYDSPSEFKECFNGRTKLQTIINKMIFPTYGFFYTAYMIRELPIGSKLFQKILINAFDRSNYFARWLCGQPVANVHYKPSRKNRWSVYLNESCDRDMRAYNDEPEFNVEMAGFVFAKNN